MHAITKQKIKERFLTSLPGFISGLRNDETASALMEIIEEEMNLMGNKTVLNALTINYMKELIDRHVEDIHGAQGYSLSRTDEEWLQEYQGQTLHQIMKSEYETWE